MNEEIEDFFEDMLTHLKAERIRKEELKTKLENGEITFKQYINELPVQNQQIIEYFLTKKDDQILSSPITSKDLKGLKGINSRKFNLKRDTFSFLFER